ncbi:Protein of unknown function DUF1566 [Beggiatoa sp. PS]|nr:Protein of unknown function DUF1566 [Beggiatoa sp. PS]
MPILLSTPLPLLAGTLNSPAAPTDAGSAMYTIEDIYNRLNDGTAGAKRSGAFTEPGSAPGATGKSLDDVMGKAPIVDDSDGAATTEVLSDKTFWGLKSGEWGLQIGTGNLAPVVKTGQTICYDASGTTISCSGTGQDGEHQKGVTTANRFSDNSDGTVTDNLTGLIWLKNANCAGAKRNWTTALSDVLQLNTDGTMNSNDCGDTSNSSSHQTDWRLSNVKELQSLIDCSQNNPALPSGHLFSDVQMDLYWSSTTNAVGETFAWRVTLSSGTTDANLKTNTYYVWPVRGGK